MSEQGYLIFLLCLIPGLLILVLGILLKLRPPRSINALYGYRTTSSMRNMDTWMLANIYSAKVMMVVGIVNLLGGTALASSAKQSMLEQASLGYVLFFVLSVITVIPITEMFLKKKFDNKGNRKQ